MCGCAKGGGLLDMSDAGALRLRSVALLIGWGMILTVIVLSLIPMEVDLSEGRDKWSHLLAYGGLMFWFGGLFPGVIRQLQIALAFIAMGVALEFLQRETGYRSFDLADMVANSIGVLLGWGLVRTPLGRLLSPTGYRL